MPLLSTRIAIALAIVVAGLPGCTPEVPVEPADLVLRNAAIYTVDDDRSWAQAVAVTDGTIVYVGSEQRVDAYIGDDTSVRDLQGAMVLPGFHDGHTHLLIGTWTEEECRLLRLETMADVEAELERCSEFRGRGAEQWIVGGGWGEWLWSDGNPNKNQLDNWFPDRPVYFDSSYGHSAWVNSQALELAGITAETPNPPLGIIERDPDTGEPTGTLRESAMSLVLDLVPDASMTQRVAAVRDAIDMAHSFGITGVIEPGMDENLISPLIRMSDSGEFNIRARISLSPIGWLSNAFDDDVFAFLEQREQWRRPNIDVDSIKIYMDGVVESGTAALLEPYDVEEFGHGLTYYDQDVLNDYMTAFDAMGLQIHIHAIGDAAVRMALDGYAAAQAVNGATDNRHQMVHLQMVNEAEIPRFGALNVSATFQPLWAHWEPSVTEFADPYLGPERTNRMYPIGSVQKAGGRIVGGSDYWVTDMNPLLAIEVAITRQDPITNDGPVLNEDERVDLATMIDAYTIHGAYQMGLDNVQGSIDVGKRADLVVLDKNLFEIPAAEISDATVLMTLFDGDVVYEQ